MRSFAFAWRSLFRQPTRAVLAIAGIAAIGALLFDMLLLSRGLLISFRDLLDNVGFDVRVTATPSMPRTGPRISDAVSIAAHFAALPEIDAVVPMRVSRATAVVQPRVRGLTFIGAMNSSLSAWTVVRGRDLDEVGGSDLPPIVINQTLASVLEVSPGATLPVRSGCMDGRSVLPVVNFHIAGIARFPFESESERMAAVTIPDFDRACGGDRNEADMLLVASRREYGAKAAVAALQRVRPDLYAFSNEQLVDRFQRVGFSYFRQISAVLVIVTLCFTFLLITVLLTVSVNQRFAEIAALRALGFRRRRIASDLLWESGLMVGIGGLVALPLGLGLATWLDSILKAMPGIPADLHFFVFQPQAVLLYIALLAAAGLLAALYPVHLASRLPMASTLRNEVVG